MALIDKSAKTPKINGAYLEWNDMLEKSPANVRELYIVAQRTESGDLVRNAAYWEQDANGTWGWNKPEIAYWMKWPEMPK
jgi:hypothetical protein